MKRIKIKKSPTADTRTCDYTKVSKKQLLESSLQHIHDVAKGFLYFMEKMGEAAVNHDNTKILFIDNFYDDFLTGFKNHSWLDMHREEERHHIDSLEGRRHDINLIDVLEYIIDCVMAGMARKGEIYPLEIPDGVLQLAFKNTIEMLEKQIEIIDND